MATWDLRTTAAEELARDIMLELAPVLQPRTEGAKGGTMPARLLACDAIANLLEWGRRNLPELAIGDGGPLEPLVEYLLWKVRHIPASRVHILLDTGLDARSGEGLRPRDGAENRGAPESEATVALSLALEPVAASRDAFDAAFKRDAAASLGTVEHAEARLVPG